MEPGKPSRTAMAAATHRLIHTLVDRPVLLSDALVGKLLEPIQGKPPDMEAVRRAAPARAGMRAHVVARSLFAEETLAKAVTRGVRQYVLLGAGLDTFAYRNPWSDIMVFESDHVDTGRWKRERLNAAGVTPPANVVYAAFDFEREALVDGLARAGFNPAKPAVFAWLGVTMYLTLEAIERTLRAVASLPEGTEIVLDYSAPTTEFPEAIRAYIDKARAALADVGEPWLSFFTPADMGRLLAQTGFSEIENLSGIDMAARWFEGRSDGLQPTPLSNVVRARV
jgi:methyltransferase (TIGR00027 family)